MLVCNVAYRPPRTASAVLTELAKALDIFTRGLDVTVLVDDPASAHDTLDAIRGELIMEVASAADILDAQGGFGIIEAIIATSTQDAIGTYGVSIDESGINVAAQDTVGVPTTTWNPADKTAAITLSGGNLIATNTVGGTAVVRSIAGQSAGKFYFEITKNLGGEWFGVANSSVALTSWVINATGGAAVHASGPIYVNNNGTGISFVSIPNGAVVSIAVDLTNKRIWFRVAGGNWNNSGTANPATNVGGIDISSVFTGVAAYACYSAGSINNYARANFGATNFAYTLPSGFNAGPI